MAEFVYRIPGKPGSSRPGAHRSHTRGPGLSFAHHARLLDLPDPRRLDLRASIRSIGGDWLVRATHQHSATVVQVLMDVSPSMHFGQPQSKLAVAADFVESLGHSAFGYGDALGMLAFDHQPCKQLTFPAHTGRGTGALLANTLREFDTQGSGTAPFPPMNPDTLLSCAAHISHGTSLVFLVSDFHWSLDSLDAALDRLQHVMLVPIVIWHGHETQPPATGRWLRTRELETGEAYSVFLRRSTRQRWLDNVTRRRAQIQHVFSARDIDPFFVETVFDAERLSRYFMEAAG